jgi:hypothetical protein
VDDSLAGLEGALLGYLNFSEGRPDVRFQRQLNDAYAHFADQGDPEPWRALHDRLRARLAELRAADNAAFRDATQAAAVLDLAFARTLPAYRQHHSDLLFHLSDRELFQPFFLARVCEAVLVQGPQWGEESRIVAGSLAQLNDFVGHRPVAILETRPRGEPYDHEKVRPIPLYLRGAGVAAGRYHELISQALAVLRETDPALLQDAGFDPTLLDELALDPRAYDHGHPVNRRPNYVFGEWDPHHLDGQGRYRRYVVRRVLLEALLDRVEHTADHDRGELLYESAAVLAGTVLMASGISGGGPAAYDSSTTLATLMPRIARYRDAFYAGLLGRLGGAHAEWLRQEAATTRQPFGGTRQHVNHYLAQHRAAQLQQRHLALIFAEMGYPDASRQQAAQIPAASIRLLSEIQIRLAVGRRAAERGELEAAARVLPEAEDLLRRGIACGALADPWNILGFQGLFPLYHSQEDAVHDPRIDALVHVVAETFNLYARLLSEAAGAGAKDLAESLTPRLRQLAAWWDRFASTAVSDVRHVHGGEAAASAEHVATALARWHERGAAAADLAFWRQHLDTFRSPKAFALVVDALLRKEDYRAAMALLMTWLGRVEQVPLEEGEYSFHELALRWMLGVRGQGSGVSQDSASSSLTPDPWPLTPSEWELVKKFFDYLEANAEEYWQVPRLEVARDGEGAKDKGEEVFAAAYEDVTYRDSAADEHEGAVAEGAPDPGEFDLDHEGERLAKRLRFLSTVARLWQVAARALAEAGQPATGRDDLAAWLATARGYYHQLLELLDAIHAHPVPEPTGSYDSLVEYDRRRVLKEQLLYHAIGTCLDTFLAAGTLQASLEGLLAPGEAAPPTAGPAYPDWQPLASRLEQALVRGDALAARRTLPDFLNLFRKEPLVFTALADGGPPRRVLQARIAQTVLRALAANLPRLGLERESFHLLRTARAMERLNRPRGRGITQFNELFQASYQAVIEAVVASAAGWPTPGPEADADRFLVQLLERVTAPFLKLWIEHSQALQLSSLESVRGAAEWNELRTFIQRYGHDLFHARFMTLANLRGILHRGAGAYFDYLKDNPDPLHPIRLIAELDDSIPRGRAVALLEWVLLAVVENYEEYKDYNTTTVQSDYGENLYTLLDFLRLKAEYERHAWELRPLVLAHEVLVRHGRYGAAVLWREQVARQHQAVAEQYLQALAGLEQAHGMRLRTVADRLHERFVKPLDLDRLCALVAPAMDEAHGGPSVGLERLLEELRAYGATPSGSGLDVPPWLLRLGQEVQRYWLARAPVAVLAEHWLQVPRRPLAYEDLERQLLDWDMPLGS